MDADALVAHVHHDAVEVDDGPHRLEPTLTPGCHFGIEIGRDL